MKNIWYVATGEYSSRSIEGVFDTEEGANRLAGMLLGGEVGCWELNARTEDEKGKTFRIWIDHNGNEVSRREEDNVVRHPRNAEKVVQPRYDVDPLRFYGSNFLAISPISFEHAIKIAGEMRQEWLRDFPHLFVQK